MISSGKWRRRSVNNQGLMMIQEHLFQSVQRGYGNLLSVIYTWKQHCHVQLSQSASKRVPTNIVIDQFKKLQVVIEGTSNCIVVSVIIDSWAKLKYPHTFFAPCEIPSELELLPYISVNTASTVIWTFRRCRAYLFWLVSTQAVWLTVVFGLGISCKIFFFYRFSFATHITT